MDLTSTAFADGERIPEPYAFGAPDADNHFRLSQNRNPQLAWSGAPEGTRSFALICVDPDVPSKPDDVNQEDREVPEDLPRVDFYHWAMVDIPAHLTRIEEGECSAEVTAGGKMQPPGPDVARQGLNTFTDWFAEDPDMGGKYFGYDGPAPPWNDSLMHHYHFKLFALDIDRVNVSGEFDGPAVLEAIKGHVLAEASIVGTYTMNQRLL
jgi:Raf kinase inhibitor-like YbhB/YbcL family protein